MSAIADEARTGLLQGLAAVGAAKPIDQDAHGRGTRPSGFSGSQNRADHAMLDPGSDA